MSLRLLQLNIRKACWVMLGWTRKGDHNGRNILAFAFGPGVGTVAAVLSVEVEGDKDDHRGQPNHQGQHQEQDALDIESGDLAPVVQEAIDREDGAAHLAALDLDIDQVTYQSRPVELKGLGKRVELAGADQDTEQDRVGLFALGADGRDDQQRCKDKEPDGSARDDRFVFPWWWAHCAII